MMCQDRSVTLRRVALRTLAELPGPEPSRLLIILGALHDQDETVCMSAIHTLHDLKAHESVPDLLRFLARTIEDGDVGGLGVAANK